MAKKVNCQVVGGTPITHDDVRTVADVQKKMSAEGYSATINGEPASSSSALSDYDYVMLAPAVKGGQ